MKMHKHFAMLTVLFFVLTLISGHMVKMRPAIQEVFL